MLGLSKATWAALLGVVIISTISATIPVSLLKESKTVDFTNDKTARNASIPPIDASAPAMTEMATFALGCFWDPDSRFGSMDGVIHTRVGYAGGTTSNPTYYNLGDHSETIQIDYHPAKISYEELLKVSWRSHNPALRPWSKQYASIIFYHNEEQRRLAIATKQREETRLGTRVFTEIIPFSDFYLAEDYHQKYFLQQVDELMSEFSVIYPDIKDFTDSTAAARVNGYINGYGTLERLQEQLSSFGLSSPANETLLEIGRRLPTNVSD